jgi:hypothetical protein
MANTASTRLRTSPPRKEFGQSRLENFLGCTWHTKIYLFDKLSELYRIMIGAIMGCSMQWYYSLIKTDIFVCNNTAYLAHICFFFSHPGMKQGRKNINYYQRIYGKNFPLWQFQYSFSTRRQLKCLLKGENNTITLGIRFLFNMHPAVDHAHDSIPKLQRDINVVKTSASTIVYSYLLMYNRLEHKVISAKTLR